MKLAFSRAALLLAAMSGIASPSVHAQETIKAGLWQFTAQGNMPASPPGFSPPSGGQSRIGGSFSNCIDPARSVPVDPQLSCRVDGMNRNGAAVTWATTCATPQGTFQSQGVAQYRGDAMTGTLTTYVPMIGGQVTQQISGRYLGPCTR